VDFIKRTSKRIRAPKIMNKTNTSNASDDADCSPSSIDAITAACEEAVERGELKKLPNGNYLSPSGWKSIAVWPKPAVNLMSADNSSTDTHGTQEAARAMCLMLRRNGCGGDGKIFPLETRVEPIFPENVKAHTPLPASASDETGVKP
jgi:hypothetical protein